MPLPILGPRVPEGYSLEVLHTCNGKRYRARRGHWLSHLHTDVWSAVNEAFDHYYASTGAKPILTYRDGKYTDVLTGLHVTDEVRRVHTFAQAFRMKSAKFQALADVTFNERLVRSLENTSRRYEEVAQRLEARQ